MNQVLHIFRKDTRRFLPEILISLVILALYVVHVPSAWRGYNPVRRQMLAQIMAALGILTPLAWWLLIARVTHAETLVGDNEFWITRPYEWKKLLGAKVLFLGLWIGLPYLLAQAYMLGTAGFHPTSYLSGLFVDLFFLSTLLILPLFSIAAVNANFARMTLTLLGILFLYIAIMFFSTLRVGSLAFNPYRDVVTFPLMFCLCAAAIAFQYATRRVWLSRALLLAVPILVLSVVYAYNRPGLVDRAYPRPDSASTSPVVIALAADAEHPIKARSTRDQDYIDLRIQYSGVAEGYAVFSDDVQFTFTAADGQQWTSSWQGNDDHILPGVHQAELSLSLSPEVYGRFKSGPVTLRITSALTRLQTGVVTAMGYPSREVSVTGIGFCSDPTRSGWNLLCRSAISQPHLAHVTALWSNVPCSDQPPPAEDTALGSTWVGLHPAVVQTLLSPVLTQGLGFSNSRAHNRYNSSEEGWQMCPGTPLTFTQYNVVDRTQIDLTIPDFHLPAVEPDR